NALLVLLGDAQQHTDRSHGHLGAEVADEVEAAAPDEGVEAAGAELADLGLERADLARGEHPGEEASMAVVRRGILEDHRAGRHLRAALDQLEDGAPCRAVRLPVARATLDVLEPAERIEVVALVVVEGLFVAEAPSTRDTGSCRSRSRTGRSR